MFALNSLTIDLPAIITSVTGLVTAIGVIVMFFAGKKVKEEVGSIHRIVNSQQTALLKTIAITARQLAAVTKFPTDEAAAIEAERQYADRLQAEKTQANADAKAKK